MPLFPPCDFMTCYRVLSCPRGVFLSLSLSLSLGSAAYLNFMPEISTFFFVMPGENQGCYSARPQLLDLLEISRIYSYSNFIRH